MCVVDRPTSSPCAARSVHPQRRALHDPLGRKYAAGEHIVRSPRRTVRCSAPRRPVGGHPAQSLPLALHGSAWLANRGTPTALEANNAAFDYTSSVRFAPLLGDPVEGVDAWLERLASAGAEMIGLYIHVGEGDD